jgi:hypothetical protein
MTDRRKGPPNRHFRFLQSGSRSTGLTATGGQSTCRRRASARRRCRNPCRSGQCRSAASRSAAPPVETPPSHDSAADRSSYALSTTQAPRAAPNSDAGSSLHSHLPIFGAFYWATCTIHRKLELVANQSLPAGPKLNPSVAMILLSCNCVAAGSRTDGPLVACLNFDALPRPSVWCAADECHPLRSNPPGRCAHSDTR